MIQFLKLKTSTYLFVSLLFVLQFSFAKVIVNDVTQINPILVEQVITPKKIEEVQAAIVNYNGKISIGGGRYSMGGQTATENALQIDMREMNKVVRLDVENKKITVQAGMRWRDIQDVIDPHNLSIKIMQTYSNFTVGGSLSVNVHGRYVGQGPLIRSIDSIKIVLADGSLVEASPTTHSEIFYGVIGGYGGLAVIVEATLQLVDNIKIERKAELLMASDYRKYFFEKIRDNPDAIFHNGDIYPPEFNQVNAVTWYKTDKPLTVKDRMIPRGKKYVVQPVAISAMTSLPFGRKVRTSVVDPLLYSQQLVTWRNHEASYDVAELEPVSRKKTTYVLQEYFVPVNRFEEFIPKMRDVFKKYDVDVFNVSIRHALPDPGSILAWARTEVFAFVVYYRQEVTPSARQDVASWTREMISEVLSVEGTYYLPYQIHATDSQFHRAYPRHQEFFDLKKKLDPNYKFRNKLWDKYYSSMPDSIAAAIANLKNYSRPENQTFLGLPEWYIVFNGDEYADFLKSNLPSDFPYWQSAKEFWNLKTEIKKAIQNKYPPNIGYNVMLWVIGSSYSIELVVKGLYENTIGRLTEFFTSAQGTPEDKLIQQFHKEYADYVHIYPWYEFSFYGRLKKFWSDTPLVGENLIRKWERKIFFSIEYLVKSGYGSVIKWATKASYEAEPTHIFAVINDPSNQLSQFKDVSSVSSYDSFHLVSIPRYDKFRDLAGEFAKTNIKFVEVAGNRKILLTVIAPKKENWNFEVAEVIAKSNVPTDKNKERLLILSSVSSLTDLLAKVQTEQLFVEHIFDY